MGAPAGLDRWDERELPALSARTVVAAIKEVEVFTGRVRAEADRVGVTTAAVTVLARAHVLCLWQSLEYF